MHDQMVQSPTYQQPQKYENRVLQQLLESFTTLAVRVLTTDLLSLPMIMRVMSRVQNL
jgi:hypothetical protein